MKQEVAHVPAPEGLDWEHDGFMLSDGDMMAGLIDLCEKGRDHDKDPFQFYLKYTRRNLNVGFYSRNRKINTDSSFSVIG